jgi:hypothetical protein
MKSKLTSCKGDDDGCCVETKNENIETKPENQNKKDKKKKIT